MNLQHVNVKLLLANPAEVHLDPLIPVFHSWIRDKVFDELLLDIADYQHVPDGPGVVLIGFEGDYSVDNTDHRLGVRYNRKTPLDGSNQDRLKQAARAALTAAQRLDADSRLNGTFRISGQEIEIFFNDRLLAPNTEATRKTAEPELKSFLQTHAGLFQSEPLFSFRQIYFNPQLHGGNLHRDMARALEDLERAGSRANTTDLGDPFLLERSFKNISLSDVKKTFGDQFASALAALQLGVWQGPVESGYGIHLVFVTQRSEGRLPALDEIRDQVRREWLDAKRGEATEKFYQAILSRYKVKIELPEEKKVAQVH